MRLGKILEPQYRVALLIPGFLCFSLGSCLTLDQLFQVKLGATAGGCDNRRPILNSWLSDTTDLVTKVMEGINARQTDFVFQQHLAAWFGIRTTKAGNINQIDVARFNTFMATMQGLSDLLNTGRPDKPWLFCGSDWLVETENVYDDRGTQIPGANSRTYTAPSTPPPAAELTSFLTDMKAKNPDGTWKNYAYWSSDLVDYNLEDSRERYLGTPPSWCNSPPGDPHFALTLTRLLQDSVTICDYAFTVNAEPFETNANGMASAAAQTLNSPLRQASPRGLTLLHELVHLVLTPEKTPDTASGPADCLGLVIGGKSIEAVANPDSYAFFAWAYYLSTMGAPARYNWASGIAS